MRRFLLMPILAVLLFSVASCNFGESNSNGLKSAYKELKLDMSNAQVVEIVAKYHPEQPNVSAGKTQSGKNGLMLVWVSETGDEKNSKQSGLMVILEEDKLIAARLVKQTTAVKEFFRQ